MLRKQLLDSEPGHQDWFKHMTRGKLLEFLKSISYFIKTDNNTTNIIVGRIG